MPGPYIAYFTQIQLTDQHNYSDSAPKGPALLPSMSSATVTTGDPCGGGWCSYYLLNLLSIKGKKERKSSAFSRKEKGKKCPIRPFLDSLSCEHDACDASIAWSKVKKQ